MNSIPSHTEPFKQKTAFLKTRWIAAVAGVFLSLFGWNHSSDAATILTTYESATGSVRATGTAENWSFYWNRNGEMGYLDSYEALIKEGSAGSFQLIPGGGQAGTVPAAYLKIAYGGGNTGFGYMNTGSGGIARGGVAAYTFQESGFFQIRDITLSRSTARVDEVLTVNVWLEADQSLMGTLTLPHSVPQDGVVSLALVDLGFLEAGSRVFVTVDPGPYNGARYYLDYSIVQVPEASTGVLFLSAAAAGLVFAKLRRKGA